MGSVLVVPLTPWEFTPFKKEKLWNFFKTNWMQRPQYTHQMCYFGPFFLFFISYLRSLK